MDSGIDTTIFAAFGVGMLSFFSPCVLPLVPGYLSAISGVQVDDDGINNPRRLLAPALLFVLSFTAIFMALGLTATGLGRSLSEHHETLRKISGVTIVLLGLLMAASLLAPRLNRDWHPDALMKRAGTGGPIVAGAAFAIAWSPCIGPTLGTILTAAANKQDLAEGAVLLFFYSAGLAIPFLATALGLGAMASASNWARLHYPVLILISSVVLVVVGVLIFTNQFYLLNIEVRRLTENLDLAL